MELAAPAEQGSGLVVIETVYDGEDLAEVGTLTGLGTDGVIAAHTGQVWTVAVGEHARGCQRRCSATSAPCGASSVPLPLSTSSACNRPAPPQANGRQPEM